MAILLSHTSALEFWRSPEGRLWRRNPQGGRPFSVRPNAKTRRAPLALESEGSHALYSPSRRDVRNVLGRPYLGLSRPIHVLVPQRNRRYHSKLVISHVQTTPLPARYIVEVAPGIFAVIGCTAPFAGFMVQPERAAMFRAANDKASRNRIRAMRDIPN